MWYQMESLAFFSDYSTDNLTRTSLALTQFFDSLGGVLPCSYCRDNYASNRSALKRSRYRSANGTAMYVYRLHNVVNKALNKKSVNVTFQEMEDKHDYSRVAASNICFEIVPRAVV